MINEQGGVNGRKINLISARRRLQPAQDGRAGPPAGRGREGRLPVQYARHRAEPRDPAISQRQQGPTAFCGHRREPVRRPGALSLDDRLQSQLPDRGARLRQAYSRRPSRRQNRRAVPERRFRQGLSDALKDMLGDKAGAMIVKEASYETQRADRRLAGRTAAGVGRRHLPDRRHAEIRRAGDPQVLRSRLGRRALSEQRLAVGRVRAETGRAREVEGPDHRRLRHRRLRSDWKDQPSMQDWKAFTDKYMSAKEYGDMDAAYAFGAAATMVQVLKQCGDDFSRENVMRQAANLKAFAAPMLIPGITVDTSPDNFSPIRELQLLSFDGTSWRMAGARRPRLTTGTRRCAAIGRCSRRAMTTRRRRREEAEKFDRIAVSDPPCAGALRTCPVRVGSEGGHDRTADLRRRRHHAARRRRDRCVEGSRRRLADGRAGHPDLQRFDASPETLARQAPGVTVGNVSGNDFQPDVSYRGFTRRRSPERRSASPSIRTACASTRRSATRSTGT